MCKLYVADGVNCYVNAMKFHKNIRHKGTIGQLLRETESQPITRDVRTPDTTCEAHNTLQHYISWNVRDGMRHIRHMNEINRTTLPHKASRFFITRIERCVRHPSCHSLLQVSCPALNESWC